MTHFNQRACPVLHAPERDAVGTEPPSDVTFACGAFEPEGTSSAALAEEPVPVFQMASTTAVAKTGNLSLLAKHLREHGRIDRCPECGIQCKPMYVTRHACKQHSWIQQAHAQVLERAKNCQVSSNPCQWCGTQFSTSNKAHRNACPTLWACGQLLLQHSKLTLPGQSALHGYGWKRGAGQGGRRAEQLRELHEAQPHHSSFDSGSQSGVDGHECGPQLEERRRRGTGAGRGADQVAPRTRQGDAAPERQTKPAVLVGQGPRPRRLQQVERGLEECSQGLGAPRAPSGGQPFGDAARLPVHHFYEEQAGLGSDGQLERYNAAFGSRQPLAGAESSGPDPCARSCSALG